MPFVIDPRTGEIFLNWNLNIEPESSVYQFSVQAVDGGGLRSSLSFVTIHVNDVNEYPPVLSGAISAGFGTPSFVTGSSMSYVTVRDFPETYCIVQPCQDSRTVVILTMSNSDASTGDAVLFSLQTPSTLVNIDSTSGRVYLITEADREMMVGFSFIVVATDMNVPSLKTLVNVTVLLLDLNDHYPVFRPHASDPIMVSEAVGAVALAMVIADDGDATPINSDMGWAVAAVQPPSSSFMIALSSTGIITPTGTARYLTTTGLTYVPNGVNLYQVNISAQNTLASPPLASISERWVQVLPFLGAANPADASKVVVNFQAPGLCLGSSAAECQTLNERRRSIGKSVQFEVWTQRLTGCTPTLCPGMTTLAIDSAVCECLLYGPSLSNYNASSDSFLISGLASGGTYSYQLRVYTNGNLQHLTPWTTHIAPRYLPFNVSLTELSSTRLNVSWLPPPYMNGALVGYQACYCLSSTIPPSACTCSNPSAGVYSSPILGPTTSPFTLVPDPVSSNTLTPGAQYELVVELTTTLSNGMQFLARSLPISFAAPVPPAVPAAAASSAATVSAGGVAGIVVGGSIFVLLVFIFLVAFIVRRRTSRPKEHPAGKYIYGSSASSMDRNAQDGRDPIFAESPMYQNGGQEKRGKEASVIRSPLLSEGETSSDTPPKDGYWQYYTQERADQFWPNDTKVLIAEDENDFMIPTTKTFISDTNMSSATMTSSLSTPGTNFTGGVTQTVEYSDTPSVPTSPSASPSKSFGLRIPHIMADNTGGELIPRSNSRSTPLVARSASKDASKDELEQQYTGEVDTRYTMHLDDDLANQILGHRNDGSMEEEFAYVRRESSQFAVEFRAAKETYNIRKNRYVNVLPAEESRVKLSHSGVLGSDYINASYVDGWRKQRAYIATQGPLPSTVQDFWRMVWEENCGIVVCATALEENGKAKCHKYWPDVEGTIQCGTLEVSHVSVQNVNDYVKRILTVRNVKTNQQREITHIFFDAWPDHGVPSSPDVVLNLLKDIQTLTESYARINVTGPVVVHCSAGIGRTGALCAIDISLNRLHELGSIDIPATILHIRRQRPGSIQTLVQYVFVYDAIFRHLELTAPARQPRSYLTPMSRRTPQTPTDMSSLSRDEVAQLHRLGEGASIPHNDLISALSAI